MHPPQDVHGWLLQVKSCPEGLNGMFPRSGSPAQTAWHISTGSSEVTGQLREDGGLAVIHPLPHSPLPTRSCILHKTTLRCHWILSLWASEEAKEALSQGDFQRCGGYGSGRGGQEEVGHASSTFCGHGSSVVPRVLKEREKPFG